MSGFFEEAIEKSAVDLAFRDIMEKASSHLAEEETGKLVEKYSGEALEQISKADQKKLLEKVISDSLLKGETGEAIKLQARSLLKEAFKEAGEEGLAKALGKFGKYMWKFTKFLWYVGMTLFTTSAYWGPLVGFLFGADKAAGSVNQCTSSCICKCLYDVDEETTNCAGGGRECQGQENCTPPGQSPSGVEEGNCYPGNCVNILVAGGNPDLKDPIKWKGAILYIIIFGLPSIILYRLLRKIIFSVLKNPPSKKVELTMTILYIVVVIVSLGIWGWWRAGSFISNHLEEEVPFNVNKLAKDYCDNPEDWSDDKDGQKKCCQDFCKDAVGKDSSYIGKQMYFWNVLAGCGPKIGLIILGTLFGYIILMIFMGISSMFEGGSSRGTGDPGVVSDVANTEIHRESIGAVATKGSRARHISRHFNIRDIKLSREISKGVAISVAIFFLVVWWLAFVIPMVGNASPTPCNDGLTNCLLEDAYNFIVKSEGSEHVTRHADCGQTLSHKWGKCMIIDTGVELICEGGRCNKEECTAQAAPAGVMVEWVETDPCNSHQCDGVGLQDSYCTDCVANTGNIDGSNHDNNSDEYKTIFIQIALFSAWKFRKSLKNILTSAEETMHLSEQTLKVSMGISKLLVERIPVLIEAMMKIKLFASPFRIAISEVVERVGSRFAAAEVASAARAETRVTMEAIGSAGRGLAKTILTSTVPILDDAMMLGMIIDVVDPNAYRSYVSNDSMVILMRNRYDGAWLNSLFLDPDNQDIQNNPCLGHQYPCIAQLSLLSVFKESKFEEVGVFQSILKAYIKAIPKANHAIIDLIIQEHNAGYDITSGAYIKWKNWIKCMPESGGGARSADCCKDLPSEHREGCINNINYCDWFRKFTHLYKKMIVSLNGPMTNGSQAGIWMRDDKIFEEIQTELESETVGWNDNLPGNAGLLLTYKFGSPPEGTWKCKDLIKNYNMFGGTCLGTPDSDTSSLDPCRDIEGDETTYQTNCNNIQGCTYTPPPSLTEQCDFGNWKNTAPPNFDIIGVSFTEQGCYLFNKIMEWESAEWTEGNIPHNETRPKTIPSERLKIPIIPLRRMKINYTDHYRLINGYTDSDVPIIISKPIDDSGTKLPLFYPSSSIIELLCKKGVNVLKELNAISKDTCQKSSESDICHACGILNEQVLSGSSSEGITSCNDSVSIITTMARGTGEGWEEGQEAWIPELYGVEYDEISGLCKYNTNAATLPDPHFPEQTKSEGYCHRMGKTGGPYQKCEEDFSDADPSPPHSAPPHCQGLSYKYCGGGCELFEGGGVACQAASFICETCTNDILRIPGLIEH